MSFSDMMSSGRGPGVIGMVMALIVLLGFGLLFMFASDEGGVGRPSIESVIAQQAKDMNGLSSRIARGREDLALAPGRTAVAKELSRLKYERQAGEEKISTLNAGVETGKSAVSALDGSFEKYKDDYRAFVRAGAKGQNLDVLTTVSGAVYKNVSIREVTAIGIQIRHDAGQKRIAFEDLSEEMKDRFQFDPRQKEEAVAAESAARGEHEAAAAVANVHAEQQMEAQREKEAAEDKSKMRATMAAKEVQIAGLQREIAGLVADRSRAAAEASAARSAGRMHINKSSSIDGNIRAKENRIAALQTEVARMKAEL